MASHTNDDSSLAAGVVITGDGSQQCRLPSSPPNPTPPETATNGQGNDDAVLPGEPWEHAALSGKLEAVAVSPCIEALNRHVCRSARFVSYLSLRSVGLLTLDPASLQRMDQLAMIDLSHNQLEAAPVFIHHPGSITRQLAASLSSREGDAESSGLDTMAPQARAVAAAATARKRRMQYDPRRSAKERAGSQASVSGVFPRLWSIDLSHNRIQELPHVAVATPILGRLALAENPLNPAELVAALRGLVAAEIVVPDEVSLEALVEAMLGVAAINGCIAPHATPVNAKKGLIYRLELQRRYHQQWPFSDVIHTLDKRDRTVPEADAEKGSDKLLDAAALQRSLMARLFSVSGNLATGAIETTEQIVFSFSDVPSGAPIRFEGEPFNLSLWRRLQAEHQPPFEAIRHLLAAAAVHQHIELNRGTMLISAILVAEVESAAHDSEAMKAQMWKLSRSLPQWPRFAVEFLAYELAAHEVDARNVDFLMIRDFLERDDQTEEATTDSEITRLSELQAAEARRAAIERSSAAASVAHSAADFRESMRLKSKLFARSQSPAIMARSCGRIRKYATGDPGSPSQQDSNLPPPQQTAGEPRPGLEAPRQSAIESSQPEIPEVMRFLPDTPSSFVSRLHAKAEIDRARTPGYGDNPRRQPQRCFPDPRAVTPQRASVGEQVRLSGRCVPPTLRKTSLIIAIAPTVASRGAFTVHTMPPDGSAAAIQRCAVLHLHLDRLGVWDPVSFSWAYHFTQMDVDANIALSAAAGPHAAAKLPKTTSEQNPALKLRKVEGRAAERSVDVLHFLRNRFRTDFSVSESAASAIRDALSSSEDTSVAVPDGHPSDPAAHPGDHSLECSMIEKSNTVEAPGHQRRAAMGSVPAAFPRKWLKSEEERASRYLRSEAFSAVDALQHAAQAMGANGADGSASRALQSAMWVMADKLGLDFCASWKNAVLCIDAAAEALRYHASAGTSVAAAATAAEVEPATPEMATLSDDLPSTVMLELHKRDASTVGEAPKQMTTSPPQRRELGPITSERAASATPIRRRPPSASFVKVRAQSASLRELRRNIQQSADADRLTSRPSSAAGTSLRKESGMGTHPTSASGLHHPFVQAAVDSMARTRLKLDLLKAVRPADDTEEPRRLACSATLRPLRSVISTSRPQFLPAAVRQHVVEAMRPASAPVTDLGPLVLSDMA